MTFTYNGKHGFNRLLAALTGVSVILHIVLVLQIEELYQSRALYYIDLSLQDASEPKVRSIPRPRVRVPVPEVQDVQKIAVRERRVPQVRINPTDNRLEAIRTADGGDVRVPATPSMAGVSGLRVSEWVPPVAASDYVTKQDYMDMVRLKIESRKKYPESAIARRVEGRVKVRFMLTQEGKAAGIEIVESSGQDELDRAASSAVTAAAPFPPVPANLFKGTLVMEITLVFQLT